MMRKRPSTPAFVMTPESTADAGEGAAGQPAVQRIQTRLRAEAKQHHTANRQHEALVPRDFRHVQRTAGREGQRLRVRGNRENAQQHQ